MNKYQQWLSDILSEFEQLVDSSAYEEVINYFNNWEEELALDLIIAYLLWLDHITYNMAKLIDNFLTIFPADWIYVQIKPADKILRNIRKSEIFMN